MKLGDVLLRQLNKIYAPSTMVTLKVKGYDIVAKTDAEGRAIQAFVGTAREDGTIKGDRYVRTLNQDRDGNLIKDHWERKGYAT
jgi:hypothetical protein